jgi:hypothetical protein
MESQQTYSTKTPMKKISKVNWSWDHGKTSTEITYDDGELDKRENLNRPPTNPSHDIAHFICGFNGGYEWDYLLEDNQMAEYNAVFMETLLFYGANVNIKDIEPSTKTLEKFAYLTTEHMVWFSKDYYYIPKFDTELRREFVSNLDISVFSQHYKAFYDVFVIEEELKKENKDVRDFNISLTMDSSIDYTNEFSYDYITKMKELLTY